MSLYNDGEWPGMPFRAETESCSDLGGAGVSVLLFPDGMHLKEDPGEVVGRSVPKYLGLEVRGGISSKYV